MRAEIKLAGLLNLHVGVGVLYSLQLEFSVCSLTYFLCTSLLLS